MATYKNILKNIKKKLSCKTKGNLIFIYNNLKYIKEIQNKRKKEINIVIDFLFIFITILRYFILIIANKMLYIHIKYKKREFIIYKMFFFIF